MAPVTRLAAVQMNPKLMKKEKNLDKILSRLKEAAANGAQLIAFPECALTGYLFSSRDEASTYAETVPGPAVNSVAAACRELDTWAVFGLIEKEEDRLYNTAALIGPNGLAGKYRKTHLPMAGLDRFLDPGDIPLTVYETPAGNIGILICHDLTFPEPARVLMLKGADIIAVPTNWPRMIDVVPRYIVHSRAVENLVHIVAADRVGTERKSRFLGKSKIVNAVGMAKASASMTREEIIYADVDLAFARRKRLVFMPGVFEMDWLKERRPEMYADITSNRAD